MRTREQAVPPGAWQDPALRSALNQVAALSHENAVLGRHLANVQARAAQQAADHAAALAAMRRQLIRLRAAALRHAIANPLMLHVPTADGFVPPEAQKAMHEGLDGNPHVTIHDYEGLDHGFAAEVGARRDEQAAQLADKRTADFFAQNVG